MTSPSGFDFDFPYSSLSLTRARLNPPFFVPSDNIFAVMLKNNGDAPLRLQSVILPCKGFIEGSAVMYFHGKKINPEATANGNKITLDGIDIPPRERVIIFFRSHNALT